MSTVERARGRWREILPRLGIDARFLVNKHQACPLCGGRNRFRFDDRDGSGSYYCNQCGAGNGLILAKKLNGWDHRTACDKIDAIIGADRWSPAPKRSGPAPATEQAQRQARIERTLAEATEPRVVDAFLRKRRLSVTSPELRGHPSCPYYDSDYNHRLVGFFPAVVAPIRAADGSLESAALLYCAAAPAPRKKFLPKVRTITGAAVRLFEPEDGTLGIAEGIATALAARELFKIPTWSVLSANGIRSWRPPDAVRRVTIFADHDRSHTGPAAAYDLAHRLAHEGIAADVLMPTAAGTDWADFLAEEGRL